MHSMAPPLNDRNITDMTASKLRLAQAPTSIGNAAVVLATLLIRVLQRVFSSRCLISQDNTQEPRHSVLIYQLSACPLGRRCSPSTSSIIATEQAGALGDHHNTRAWRVEPSSERQPTLACLHGTGSPLWALL